MKKPNVPKFLKNIQKAASKHSPEILTAIGIVGMVSTTVLAVKATPKALKLIEDTETAKKQDSKKNDEKLKPVEVVKVAWKPYIPAAVTGAVSIACLIGANSVHAKRNAALATAYQVTTAAFNDYKDQVKETVGEEKEKEIREKVVQKEVNNLVFHEDGVIHTGNGNTLFFEPISKTVFRSSRNAIEKAVNDLNWRMTYGSEPYLSLGDFLSENKLPKYPLGEELGWRTDKGLIDVAFLPTVTDIGEPCLSIDFLIPPEWDFDNLY